MPGEEKPPICPDYSGAQVVPYNIELLGQAAEQPGVNLAGIQGAPQVARQTQVVVKGGFGYKLPPMKEGEKIDPKNPPSPLADPITIRCIGGACAAWDHELQDCVKYKWAEARRKAAAQEG